MAFGRGIGFLKTPLAVLLAVALLGVAVQECAAMKQSCPGCCLPTPGCLSLDFSQSPAAAPEGMPPVPAPQFALLAVLVCVAARGRSFPEGGLLVPVRSDPGRRRAPSRSWLHSWTL